MTWKPNIEPSTERYYAWDIDAAISDARTIVDEWDYQSDPHGYCHSRSIYVALLAEIDRLRGQEAE